MKNKKELAEDYKYIIRQAYEEVYNDIRHYKLQLYIMRIANLSYSDFKLSRIYENEYYFELYHPERTTYTEEELCNLIEEFIMNYKNPKLKLFNKKFKFKNIK